MGRRLLHQEDAVQRVILPTPLVPLGRSDTIAIAEFTKGSGNSESGKRGRGRYHRTEAGTVARAHLVMSHLAVWSRR